jgi:hypothetical protein
VGSLYKICRVCSSEREVRNAVNKLLDEKPRKSCEAIAKEVGGFSKSGVQRHSRHYKSGTGQHGIYKGEKIHVLWEHQNDSIPATAGPHDWLVIVSYAPPLEKIPAPVPLENPTEKTPIPDQR